jgi:hypothetical protein
MKARNLFLALSAVPVIGLSGCGGNISQQIVTNEHFRSQVFDVIVAHKDLALKAVDRFMAVDSVRAAVVDHMLLNEEGAKQVLIRIGTNPQALDLAMGVAVRDSAMRQHVLTLMKGVEMMTQAKK